MMLYLLKSAVLLALLYGGFALLLSCETFHRFNRLALLCVMVASLVLPAIQLDLEKPSYLCYEEIPVPQIEIVASPTQYVVQDIETPLPALSATEEKTPLPTFRIDMMQVVQSLYFIGLLVSLVTLFWQLFRLWGEIRSGLRTKDEFGNTIVIRGGDFAPYSFLHYIIISASDYEYLRRPILTHEQAHIRLRHTYDLLLLEAVKAIQWFNPFVYLLGRDLKTVHEYEADNAVLNFGIDAKTYQLLLVTKAVGSRLQTVCNNLSHHSLKNRIKMMHKNKSNRWLMGKGIILPALMALALVAFAKPKTETEDKNGKPVTMASSGGELLMTDAIEEIDVTEKNPEMLRAYIVPSDAPEQIKKRGNGIVITWLKGTWVEKDDGSSFIEEHPVCTYPWLLREKDYKFMLDGKEIDINHLPHLLASALKKMEVSIKNHSVNLITKPVQIPAGVKGNINPELTILLTGTPPKDSGAKTSIWTRAGIFDGFSWKNYTICSWKWDIDDVGQHLEEVAIRKDHNVRINVCKGVPQEHIDRIKRIMREKGVTNYTFVNQ